MTPSEGISGWTVLSTKRTMWQALDSWSDPTLREDGEKAKPVATVVKHVLHKPTTGKKVCLI